MARALAATDCPPHSSRTRSEVSPCERGGRLCLGLTTASAAAYAVVFSVWSIDQCRAFGYRTFDFAIFEQATWLISRGHLPYDTVRGLPILADHFSAVLVLLAPLYRVWSDPRLFLIVQSVALAAGAIPVYLLAAATLRSPQLGLMFGCSYLLYPALHWVNASEFHPEALAVPALLAGAYFAEMKRLRPCLLCLSFAALTKEVFGPIILLFGAWLFIRDRRAGICTIALGLVWTIMAFGTIRAFNGGHQSAYMLFFRRYGASPSEIAQYSLFHPSAIAQDVASSLNLRYAGQMLWPLLFLPLLGADVLLVAAPALFVNLLSDRGEMHTICSHYAAPLIPFVFAAAIIGLRRLQRVIRPWARRALGLYVLVASAFCLWWSPLARRNEADAAGLPPSSAAGVRRVLAQVPATASVSAQVALLPDLAGRDRCYVFPNPFLAVAVGTGSRAIEQQYPDPRRALIAGPVAGLFRRTGPDYVALCPPTSTFPLAPGEFMALSTALVQSDQYGIIAISTDSILLERGADHANGLRLLAKCAGAPDSARADARSLYLAWSHAASPASATRGSDVTAVP